jgi:hypothetical protein
MSKMKKHLPDPVFEAIGKQVAMNRPVQIII